MSSPVEDPQDLVVTRVIRASRARIWRAWIDPARFEQWWVPAPARCKVTAWEPRPGGAFETQISEDGGPFVPHMSACFLDLEPERRIVFTNALVRGWRPAEQPFITGVITMEDHPNGVEYRALAMHKSRADSDMHAELGFYDGWGQVTAQLAALAEAGE